MYQYHGWLSTLEEGNDSKIFKTLKKLNEPYPVSVDYVNGELHIAFSGNPNRDLGQTEKILDYLCGLNLKMSGCVYINDPDSERFNSYDVIKIVEDASEKIEDKNFTQEETSRIFE